MTLDCDYVVAGTGPGGSAAAGRLAEGGARVVVLEPGPRPEPRPDAMEAVSRYYAHAGLTAAVGEGLLPLPYGRALGGTTAINSGTCLRPPEELVRGWAARVPGFDADRFLSLVEEVWIRIKVREAPESTMSSSSRLFLEGLSKLGIPGGHRLHRSEDGCEGAGRCCFVCPTGAKMTADRAFLDPVKGKVDLRLGWQLVSVEPGAPARAVVRGPEGRRALSCRGVILACGSLSTPYFLESVGAPAGSGLTVHPAAKVFARFDRELEGWHGVPQGAGLVDPVEPKVRYEGVFTPPELAALTIPLEGRALKAWMDDFPRAAGFGFMVRDSSRGSVHYPLGPGNPVVRYRMNDEDKRLMLHAMRFVGKTLLAAGAREVLLPLNGLPASFTDAAALERADLSRVRASQLQLMAFHPLGTGGLGRAVDGGLKAAEGVYACDGSVVPESLGVNPQVTIYAFGLYLAEKLLGRHAS